MLFKSVVWRRSDVLRALFVSTTAKRAKAPPSERAGVGSIPHPPRVLALVSWVGMLQFLLFWSGVTPTIAPNLPPKPHLVVDSTVRPLLLLRPNRMLMWGTS